MKALPQTFRRNVSLLAIASCLTNLSSAQEDRRRTDPTPSQSRNSAVDARATSRAIDLSQNVLIASIDAEERSLRRYAGQKMLNTEGAELGTIRDFIVRPQSSQVRYFVVSSGGFLGGMGNSLRLVPVEVVQRTSSQDAFEVDILQSAWLQVPPVSDANYVIDRFDVSGTRHQEMIGRFGSAGRTDRPAIARSPTTTTPQDESSGLIRASVLRGKAVHAADRKVGDIENIIVDVDSGTAAALVDASGGFTGTTGKYLIPLNRLAFESLRQGPIGSNLTREDFDRAQTSNFGLAARTEATQTRSAVEERQTRSTVEERSFPPTGRPNSTTTASSVSETLTASARAIRQAINDDPGLVAERVQVTPENGKIVLSGSVKSETARSTIEKLARQATPTAQLENRIVVENR